MRVAALAYAMLSACTTQPIEWSDVAYGPAVQPPADAACDAPVTAATRGQSYRVRWHPLDSRPVFVLAAQRQGGEGVVIDSRGAADSCEALPRPSAFADSMNGYLHVAYYAPAARAEGVYYAHSMDAPRLARRGAGMFEPPVAVTYGARRVRTAVASRGDTLVVAYEDPNSATGGIWIALSTTAGHAFSHWLRLTDRAVDASRPAVQLRGGEVAVHWVESAGGVARAVSRRGRFR